MAVTARKRTLQTTTVRLPKVLYDEARSAVREGRTAAGSLNELLVESLGEKLKHLRRVHLDAEFVGMRGDSNYRKESELLAEQFATNDRETIEAIEKVKP
jgi:hypothetical protein